MAENIGRLVATAGLQINPFEQSAQVLKRQISSLKNEMKSMESTTKGYGKSVNGLRAKEAILAQQVKASQAVYKEKKRIYENLSGKIGDVNKATDKEKQALLGAEGAMHKASAKAEKYRLAHQNIQKELIQTSSHFLKDGKSLIEFGTKMRKTGDKIAEFGKKASFISALIIPGLGLATKSAVTFSSELQKMSALLDDGHTSADELKKQLRGLGDASRKWSVQYGISTSAINDGMEEIIKKGYTYEQTLGAMPSILDASIASGEDFNTVMDNSTSILEQFGLKVDDTATTLKNTQRVTDTLTFVANKTAAGFSDMGLAMEYVGPVAHSLGLSLEQTSAAIGLMSNNGIEGEKAGTALRGALSKLMKPSKQNIAGFEKLGISVKAFQKGTLDLPTILDKIKNNTKNWTDQQRASAVALAFGIEAQTGMNVLIHQGGDALRRLTKETGNATGYTKNLAKAQGETAQNKINRFKETIHVLAIELGDKLLPQFMPLIENATEWVRKFAEMDESTQRTIIKIALLGAAFGPATFLIGKFISISGSAVKTIGFLYTGIGKLTTGAQLAKKSTDIMAAGTSVLSAGAGSAAKSVGLFGLAMHPIGTSIGVIGLALTAGVVAWKMWGEKVAESRKRLTRWGTDVDDVTNKSLTDFQNFANKAGASVNSFNEKIKDSAEKIKTNYQNVIKQMEKARDQYVKDTKVALGSLDGTGPVQEKAKKHADEQKKIMNESINNAKKYVQNIIDITKNASNMKRNLTVEESNFILQNQRMLNEEEVKMLEVSYSEKKKILAALNADTTTMSKAQINEAKNNLQKNMDEIKKNLKKQKEGLKELYKDDTNSEEYKEQLKALDNITKQSMDSVARSYVKLALASGENTSTAINQLTAYGYSWEDMVQLVKKESGEATEWTSILTENTANLSEEGRKAADNWKNLVFDPKTGTVKTNAVSEIQKASKSKDGWDQLKFIIKHANLNTNAKKTLTGALIENGKWDRLNFEEKELLTVYDSNIVKNALISIGQWENLDPNHKKLITESNTPAQVESALMKIGLWNKLPEPLKKYIRADNHNLVQALNTSGDAIVKYNGKNISLKELVANNKDVIYKLSKGEDAIVEYNGEKVNLKKLFGDNKGLLTPLKVALAEIDNYNESEPKDKKFNGETNVGEIVGPINLASNSWDSLYGLPSLKEFTVKYNSVGSIKNAARGTNFHSGGFLLVNDAMGKNYRELVTRPDGFSFIPEGRNVLLNEPRGTKVLRGEKTERLLRNIPRFAKGTGYDFTQTKGMQMLADMDIPKVISYRFEASAKSDSQKDTIQSLLDINEKMYDVLQALLRKDTHVYLNKRSFQKRLNQEQGQQFEENAYFRGGELV